MDQTATSSASKPADAGLTLLEMLAALAMTAIVTSFVGLSLAGGREARSLDQAAIQLAGDMRAARTEALRSGQAVALMTSPAGYAIEALEIERRWPTGLDVRWETGGERLPERDGFTFSSERLSQSDLTIRLQGEAGERRIHVEAITGRVHGDD